MCPVFSNPAVHTKKINYIELPEKTDETESGSIAPAFSAHTGTDYLPVLGTSLSKSMSHSH